MSASGVPDRDDLSFLDVGRVVAPFGLAGEVRVMPLTDFPERFGSMKRVLVGEDRKPYRVVRARAARGQVVLKLRGVDGPEAAEALRGQVLRVPLAEAAEIETGQYFWYQIIDLDVVTAAGDRLGKIADIIRTGANDVYVVRGKRGEILIPAIEDVIREVDLETGRIVVELLPGLVDDGTA